MSKHKIRPIGQSVTISHWMKFRPYRNFSSYDGYYLRLANRIFQELSMPDTPFYTMLNRDIRIQLSVIVASWAEDMANGIGLWDAFVRENKSLFDFYLPFYNMADYSMERLNWQDVAYLLWHNVLGAKQLWISPDSPGLIHLARRILDIISENFEEAPETEFYDHLLDIHPDDNFFKVKQVLAWTALSSYLLAPQFNKMLKERLENFMEESAYKGMDPAKVAYSFQDDFLYVTHASFLGFPAVKWLSLLFADHKELAAAILRLRVRVSGEFVFEAQNDNFYTLKMLHTGRKFQVFQESASLKGIPLGNALFTSLVEWNGMWWITGIAGDLGKPLKPDRKMPEQNIPQFYGWSAEQQALILETEQEIEESFLNFFGDRLVVFENQNALEMALTESNKFYNLNRSVKPGKKPEFRKIPVAQWGKTAVAAFYIPGEGVTVSDVLPDLIRLLLEPDINHEDKHRLFYGFFLDLEPSMVKYIREHYPLTNLCFPADSGVDLPKHIDFLQRFFNPEGFRDIRPNNTLLPPEVM